MATDYKEQEQYEPTLVHRAGENNQFLSEASAAFDSPSPYVRWFGVIRLHLTPQPICLCVNLGLHGAFYLEHTTHLIANLSHMCVGLRTLGG